MSKSFVDAGSLNQIVQAMDLGSDKQYDWCLQSAVNTTVLLLSNDIHHLPPAIPNRARFYPGALDHLTDSLLQNGVIAPRVNIEPAILKNSMTATKSWASKNCTWMRAQYHYLLAGNNSFLKWLEWSVENTWSADDISRGVLFDRAFSKYIARILSIDESEVIEMHKKSMSLLFLKDLVANRNGSMRPEFELISAAYVISFMLRGKYHDLIASKSSCQISQHPIRELTRRECAGDRILYEVGQPIELLARIIFYGAVVSQRSLKDRLDCWVYNLVKARSGIYNSSLLVVESQTETAALSSAAQFARKCGLETGGKRVSNYINVLSGLAVGALTEVCIESWGGSGIGILTGVAADSVLRKTGYMEHASTLFHNSERRLRSIASDSGRRNFRWKPSS